MVAMLPKMHSRKIYSLTAFAHYFAEGKGFEPLVSCPTHAFQACALDRYATPPMSLILAQFTPTYLPDP